ncbi:MAG: hypothetical protein IJ237_03535 [Oscillospiraceae bacterium]|nr:hypothetical protein [Oscillospiraceae bacterium]
MKKSVAFLMILAIVLSLGVSASAATADTAYYPDDYMPYDPTTGQIPRVNQPSKPIDANPGLLILYMEDDTLYDFVPMHLVTNVEYNDAANLLNTKVREAFAEAYKEAKAVEGKHLRKAYWFNIPDNYTLDDEHYAKYLFACEGSNVEVTVNGEPIEVVSVNGRTSYIAKVTARGTIAIYSDK